MRIISAEALRFRIQSGEIITIDVSGNGNMIFLVTARNGDERQQLTGPGQFQFTLNSNARIILFMGFDSATGPSNGTGKYTVSVKGDRSDRTFTTSFSTRFGVPLLVKPLTFLL